MATYTLKIGAEEYELEVEEEDGSYRVKLGDTWAPLSVDRMGDSARYSILIDKKPYDVFAEERPNGYQIVIGSRRFEVTLPSARGPRRGEGEASDVDADTEGGEWVLTSPMAGVVQDVSVEPGDEVEKGQVVMVIEAMKMQNDLHARRAGTVKAVYVSVGERVEQGTKLLVVL